MIDLRTLGTLELASADRNAVGSVLTQPRRAALLCYLALAVPRGFHRRDTLFALFWPEYDADQARHALRQSVYFLRRALGSETIVSRGDGELGLAPDQVRCDVWAFDTALDQGRSADALALYRGELLTGFHISDAPEFERWLDEERSRLRQRAGEAGWALAATRERDGDAPGAVDAARRAAGLFPTDETALRRLLLLLERVGDRGAAVRAYEAFAGKLEGEYELEPSAETQGVVARIRGDPGGAQAATAGYPPSAPPGTADLHPHSGLSSRGLPNEPRPMALSSRARRLAASVWGAVVILVLLALAGFYLGSQARGRTLGAPRPPPAQAAPGVAVLPFAVQDAALASWREGLVDLLSLDLSGVTGLRAIDSRTLLARWREQVPGAESPELATALEVARRAGASYAVAGSVIASGSDLLLTAGVHEVEGRRILGTARSQGSADSIPALVDRLTLEVLRLILRGKPGRLPRIDLARVSTASLLALKSYLEGEALFRKSQFQSAAQAYANAVEADSTFALARYRLGLSRQWSPTSVGPPGGELYPELERFADRLPPHEAALFRADVISRHNAGEARELLEEEVRRHPDDAETWHHLGEFYFHRGAQALVPPEAADRAFARALELDSTFTLPYVHRIDHVISEGDTSGVHRLFVTFARLAPESQIVAWYRVLTDIAFGDPASRSAAEAQMDTLGSWDLLGLGLRLEGRRCCWSLSEHLLRRAWERDELRPAVTGELFWVSLAQGKVREALRWFDDPFMPAKSIAPRLLALHELGVPIPAARLDSMMRVATPDTADAFQLFYGGIHSANRARGQVPRSSLVRLNEQARRLRATGDSSEAGFTEALAQALEGYASWRRGRRDTALRLLEGSQSRTVGDRQREVVNIQLRWWLGRLLLEMGRPREALPYFESLHSTWLPADLERGYIYERLGEVERSREAYALFLAPRQQADPMFQPVIRQARAALQRLAVATFK